MELEKRLAAYISETRFDELPKSPIETEKYVILTVLGTAIAGASAPGCEAVVAQVKEWGGREEATIMFHGGRVPACNAALANSTMARARDFCDAMHPGMHVGSSTVPTALAAAELVGGCSGKEFLAALILGTEVAARINSISVYDGFDPTGICSIFASTAVAGRILRLNSQEMLHALALAFNKSGGSFQCNIDGSLAVQMIQGFVSQAGIVCAQFAQRGLTGPKNFLEGVYGYRHLYGKNKHDLQTLTRGLGERFEMIHTLFKRHPSCGGTLASTDAILDLVREKSLLPHEIERIDVQVSPHIHRLVGHPFKIGDNPKVNAQFNIQYCVANAVIRRSSKLSHFEESAIRDPEIMRFTRNIHVSPEIRPDDPERLGVSLRTHMKVTMKKGEVYSRTVEAPRGSPENPMTKEEHMERFQDCINYAPKPLPRENVESIVSTVGGLEETRDVRKLIALLS